jgi:2-keto-4-pentenoate hydratase
MPCQVRERLAPADLAQPAQPNPMNPLTTEPDIDVVDAYEIQLINIRSGSQKGARQRARLACRRGHEMMAEHEPRLRPPARRDEVSRDTPGEVSEILYPRGWVESASSSPTTCPARLHRGRLAATAAAPFHRADRHPVTDWKIKLCDPSPTTPLGGWCWVRAGVPKDIDIRYI